MKMQYRKLQDSQLWTPAPFSSVWWNHWGLTDLLSSLQWSLFWAMSHPAKLQPGFPMAFFFPLDMVTTATGTQTTLFPAWRGFVGCFLQLEFNCDQMSGWQLCWGGLTHTQQDLIKLQGTLKRSEQRELEAAQADSGAVPAPHGTGRKSIAVSLNED